MKQLVRNADSRYVEAMNRLSGKNGRQRVVAYVESYEDIFFWSTLLRTLETPSRYFEVMLPSRTTLSKGKKIALSNSLGARLGSCMIACVDADYDYLLQGVTPLSEAVCKNPYIFHTYAYAIENFQCYAPALHNVCVMTTLNDRSIFDFETFLAQYSSVIYPLFIWNVWCYRFGEYKNFSMLDFYHFVRLEQVDLRHPERTLDSLRHLVNAKMARLQKTFPAAKKTYKPLREELQTLGVTPETTYLFMRGHDLFDGVVVPLLNSVCEVLHREREREIRRLANHQVQMQNELAAYQHAVSTVEEMLRRHTNYVSAPLYQRIINDVARLLDRIDHGKAPAVPQHQDFFLGKSTPEQPGSQSPAKVSVPLSKSNS